MGTTLNRTEPTHLVHYTLNTGHSRLSPRIEVLDEVVTALQPLARKGKHDIPVEGYQISVRHHGSGLIATVLCDKRECALFGVAADGESAKPVWNELAKHYADFADDAEMLSVNLAAAKCPDRTPWCAAVTFIVSSDEAFWIADFERCMAWAWLESTNSATA